MKTLKKTFIHSKNFVLATLAIVIIFASCSSEEEQSIQNVDNNDSEYTLLINTLNDYSLEFTNTHPTSLSRGGWKRFWNSVKADYLGYTDADNIRHESLAISTSRKYWKDEKLRESIDKINEALSLSTNERNQIRDQINDLVQIYRNDSTNFGAFHNAVILNLLLENNMDFNTTEELASSTLKSLSDLGFDTSDTNAETLASEIDCFFENTYSDNTDIVFDRLISKYPKRKSELKILKNYILTVENLDSINDIRDFTDGYTSIINQSKIKTCEKEKLSANISIAPASRQLWEKIDSISL